MVNTDVLEELTFIPTNLVTLPEQLEKARLAEKHVLLWDLTGSVPLYMDDANEADFMHEMVKVALCKKPSLHSVLMNALKLLRQHLINSMVSGTCMLLNLGMLTPDFRKVYTNDEVFPANIIFDSKKWNYRRAHLPYLERYIKGDSTSARDSHNKDAEMSKSFQLVLRTSVECED